MPPAHSAHPITEDACLPACPGLGLKFRDRVALCIIIILSSYIRRKKAFSFFVTVEGKKSAALSGREGRGGGVQVDSKFVLSAFSSLVYCTSYYNRILFFFFS